MNKLTNLLEEVADVLFTIALIISCLVTFVFIIPFLLIYLILCIPFGIIELCKNRKKVIVNE